MGPEVPLAAGRGAAGPRAAAPLLAQLPCGQLGLSARGLPSPPPFVKSPQLVLAVSVSSAYCKKYENNNNNKKQNKGKKKGQTRVGSRNGDAAPTRPGMAAAPRAHLGARGLPARPRGAGGEAAAKNAVGCRAALNGGSVCVCVCVWGQRPSAPSLNPSPHRQPWSRPLRKSKNLRATL